MNGGAWMRDIKMLGCVVCHKLGWGKTPADAHHLLRNGRRIDDLHTIPLCEGHHRSGLNNEDVVSRHPWHREFERRYGSEEELLALTRELHRKEFAA
jgi:hypothetical protein